MSLASATECQLRTGAWYGDTALDLDFPPAWHVSVLWPRTPPPLTDRQIIAAMEGATGQTPLRQLCLGKRNPVVIIDDLNRPTPVARIMPFLLKMMQEAGISLAQVSILVATGTHGPPNAKALLEKIGPEAASVCRILVHDSALRGVNLGKTSRGTPVTVNKNVVTSDLVLGIGGTYPNHTAGFGGGTKLALGVLGFHSIMRLHYGHQGVGWGASKDGNSFRADLDEIARMIRLDRMISLQINSDRQVIYMDCGDPVLCRDQATTFAKRTFNVRMADDANVVIANAYPNDLSLTFARMKGFAPLSHCRPGVSRIAIASCAEGMGQHGLFPLLNNSLLHRLRQTARRLTMMRAREIPRKLAQLASRQKSAPKNPIWLYRPGEHAKALPAQVAGIGITISWAEILEKIRVEQAPRTNLKVLLFPCAPLQSVSYSGD